MPYPCPSPLMRARRRGFTVVEWMVSVGIAAVILLLTYASMKNVQERLRGIRCVSNLRSIGVATAQYITEHQGRLPVAHEVTMQDGVPTKADWSGPVFGAWYWNLAPYLQVPRWETNKTLLGEEGQKVRGPVVFTCPAQLHAPATQRPLAFPSNRPVSYAPSSAARPTREDLPPQGTFLEQWKLSDIRSPARKIWISDSTFPNILNISRSRWTLPAEDPNAWARHAFTRHGGAGNALFFDGHVETLPFSQIANADLSANLERLFTLSESP